MLERPLSQHPLYQVLLLPKQEVVAQNYSLREASAWMRTYNQVMAGTRRQAVIALQSPARSAA